ncbi:hypothetical protein [Photobacterium iliopiscarium]|uniref:hypothetical protein n=1 Tax=Photobacterium iliopiscarium TaxID=56192 RepID=UPI000D15FF25|nr:hypothetical protein [Photobacterium iliopiscarium]PST99828.1 hypothetical protein C9I85_09635 [Photobacterium iliopiscarium]PSV85116.1 hypothetical protein C9J51_02235 [Photobacterium iliopiscarium]
MKTLGKEQQFERLYATPPVYEWELIVNPDHGRTKIAYASFGICIILAVVSFFWFQGNTGLIAAGMLIFLGSCGAPWGRFLIHADKRHYYAINQYGMYSTSEQIIPEIAYTIVRRSAWVGCAICVFAAIFIGPMAFVGAGGAALMSFTMTNFRSIPHKSQCLFDGYVNFEYYKSCKSFINTKEKFFACIIPEEKIAAIENTLLQFNETFEKEYIDDFEDDPKFQAFPVILEIVR